MYRHRKKIDKIPIQVYYKKTDNFLLSFPFFISFYFDALADLSVLEEEVNFSVMDAFSLVFFFFLSFFLCFSSSLLLVLLSDATSFSFLFSSLFLTASKRAEMSDLISIIPVSTLAIWVVRVCESMVMAEMTD